MATESNQIEPPSRPFQFSLRSLLYCITVFAAICAAGRVLGPRISFEFLGFLYSAIVVAITIGITAPLEPIRRKLSPVADGWLAAAVNFFAFAVFCVFARIASRNYVDLDIKATLITACVMTVPLFVVFAVSRLAAADEPTSSSHQHLAYYPLARNVIRAFQYRRLRIIVFVGVGLTLRYYSMTIVHDLSSHYRTTIDSPAQVLVVCMALWSLCWLVDCMTRPHRATIGAPIFYLCLAAFIALAG